MSDPTSHRDSHGRFTAGNPGGTGNPFHRQKALLRKAFAEVVAYEDMVLLAKKVFAAALNGNMSAARMVLQYCIGKPGVAADPDTFAESENHGEHRGHGETQKSEPRGHGGHGEKQEVVNGEAGTIETEITAVKEPRGHGGRQGESGETGTVATEITEAKEPRGHGERQEEGRAVATGITVREEPQGQGGHGEMQEWWSSEPGTVATEITAVKVRRAHAVNRERRGRIDGGAGTVATEITAALDWPDDDRETVDNGMLATGNVNGA